MSRVRRFAAEIAQAVRDYISGANSEVTVQVESVNEAEALVTTKSETGTSIARAVVFSDKELEEFELAH